MQVVKQFYKSVSLLLLLNIVLKPIWILGIDRQVQLIVGATTFGNYYALLQLATIFSIVLDFGLGIYYTTNYTNTTKAILQGQFKHLLIVKIVLSLAYTLLILILYSSFGVPITNIIGLLIVTQIANSFLLFGRNYFTIHQLYTYDAWLSVTDKLLATAIIGYMLYMPTSLYDISIQQYITIPLCCKVLLIIVVYAYIFNTPIQQSSPTTITHSPNLKKIIPYTLVILLMAVLLRSHIWLLKVLHPTGTTEVAVYAYGYRLLDAFNSFGYLVAAFLFPFICKHLPHTVIVHKVLRQLTIWLWVLCFVLIVGVFICKNEIATMLYHTALYPTPWVIWYSCTACLGCGLVHIYSSVLTAANAIQLLIKITLSFTLLSIVTNIIVIPLYGAIGTAIVCSIVQLGYGVTLWVYSRKTVATQKNN